MYARLTYQLPYGAELATFGYTLNSEWDRKALMNAMRLHSENGSLSKITYHKDISHDPQG